MASSSNPRSNTKQRFSSSVVKSMMSTPPASSAKTPGSEACTFYNPNNVNTTTNTTMNRSVFSPILTPADKGKSIILLSPSRTLSESLTSIAIPTGTQLEQIWDEIGYSPEDRASQLTDILLKFRDICEQKIAEEQNLIETFRQTITEAKEEIKSISTALKTDVDLTKLNASADGEAGLTLTDELQSLETVLKTLREQAAAAKEDLDKCREYLVEAHQALGLPMDNEWDDIDSDLTEERRKQFHDKKDEMKKELSLRTEAIVKLVQNCQHFMNELRMEPEKDGSDLDRRIAGSLVRSKDGSFIMASKFRSDSCVGISNKATEELTRYVAALQAERTRRKIKMQEMGVEISVLWEKLQIPEEEQRDFTRGVQGLSLESLEWGEAELNRLRTMKSTMLGKLIADARDEIVNLWNETNATDEIKQSFPAFQVMDENLFDDELLEKHEDYVVQLKERLEQMQPIIRLIERREGVLRERFEYEELQKDPERLKQRGAAMTKQLMAEEKMAKRIKRDLPKLTETLLEKLAEWKQIHGEDFQFHGEVYTKTMERQKTEWKQYKEGEMQRKLKKKQEETALDNNRFGPVPVKQRRAARPLADNNAKQNISPKNDDNKKTRQQRGRNYKSHGIGEQPARTLGAKTASTRF